MSKRMRDADDEFVQHGDWISFSYGIPPVGVHAEIIERDGKLIALTPGHTPEECSLRALKGHVGAWFKATPPASNKGD